MREDDSNWFSRWEEELPSPEELMPLSQTLITPDLALAFDIRNPNSAAFGVAGGSPTRAPAPTPPASQLQPPAMPQPNSSDFGDSADLGSGGGGGDEPARTLKRPRLVWTPQLHKRFVDAVAHLGIKNAVPKTIMQLMSVDGLTRENVASHLQKYRLYLKRMQSLSGGGAGGGSAGSSADPTDHLFASSPVPAHFLHPGSAPVGRPGSEHYLPFVPVAALQHHHHQQHMAAAVAQIQGGPYGHRQVGHFGSAPAGNGGVQFDHSFLGRQGHGIHRLGASVHSGVSGYVEDLDSGANASATERKALTLFPTGKD